MPQKKLKLTLRLETEDGKDAEMVIEGPVKVGYVLYTLEDVGLLNEKMLELWGR